MTPIYESPDTLGEKMLDLGALIVVAIVSSVIYL